MRLRVDYLEIDKVQKNSINIAAELEKEIDFLFSKTEELKAVWEGQDADIFFKNSQSFIKRMKVVSSFLDTFGNFIGDSNKSYRSKEENFKIKLEKEKSKNEQDNNKRFF